MSYRFDGTYWSVSTAATPSQLVELSNSFVGGYGSPSWRCSPDVRLDAPPVPPPEHDFRTWESRARMFKVVAQP